VGNKLEELYAHQLEELEAIAGQLARHFHEAGDDERALKYSMQAGDRAIRLYAYEEARQFLQRALKLSEADETLFEKRMELLERLGDVHNSLRKDTQAISYYQSALELLSDPAGADKMIAVRLHRKILEAAILLRGIVEFEAFETLSQTLAASRTYLEATLQSAQREQTHLEWVRALTALAKYTDTGIRSPSAMDTAEGYAQAAVDLAAQLDAPEELSDALETLGDVYYARGLLPEQLEVSRRRLALSRDPRFGDWRKRITILVGLSSALMAIGEYDQAITHLLEEESLAIQVGAVASLSFALGLQAFCWFRLDRWDELLKLDEKRRDLEGRYSRDQVGAVCLEIALSASVRALQGDLDQARVMRERARRSMEYRGGESPENWARGYYY
jgi:tetratricopeptide (TPR) repeat protein